VWQVAHLAPDTEGVITITGVVAGNAAGVYTNTARITAEGDAYAGDNVASVTLSVASSTCAPLTEVMLRQLTPGPVTIGTVVSFQIDLHPFSATPPFTYTTDGGAAQTTAVPSVVFTRTFALTGTHTITVEAWNCAMTSPMIDTLPVTVLVKPPQRIYLPLVRRR
jgi:hypothetical protein